MSRIRDFYLRASPSKTFFVIATLYLADEFVGTSLLGPDPVPIKRIPLETLVALQTSTMLLLAVYLGWFWAMGTFLHPLVKPSLRLSLAFFKFALVFEIAYSIGFLAFDLVPRALGFYVILPVHLFAMLCMIYIFRFVAKSLALQGKGRYLNFRDYSSVFFLLFFFPFTVWWVQPKIDRLYRSGQPGS